TASRQFRAARTVAASPSSRTVSQALVRWALASARSCRPLSRSSGSADGTRRRLVTRRDAPLYTSLIACAYSPYASRRRSSHRTDWARFQRNLSLTLVATIVASAPTMTPRSAGACSRNLLTILSLAWQFGVVIDLRLALDQLIEQVKGSRLAAVVHVVDVPRMPTD